MARKLVIKPKITYSKWVIAVAQNARQLQGIQDIIAQKRIDYYGVYPAELRDREMPEFIRQLEVQEAMGLSVQTELLAMRDRDMVLKRTWWDTVVMRLYQWSQG